MIRTQRQNVIEISSPPGEDHDAAVQTYMEELGAYGHRMSRAPTIAMDSAVHRCLECHIAAREYRAEGRMLIFSDFEEGRQCHRKQMNILCLGNAR